MIEQKYCKDCKHYRWLDGICSSPMNTASVISGKPTLMRAVENRLRTVPFSKIFHCGPNADFFEPKISMKPCKDCKFQHNDILCLSPKNGISPVDGEPSPRFSIDNRKGNLYSDKCGISADWFEQKEVKRIWWKFWKNE